VVETFQKPAREHQMTKNVTKAILLIVLLTGCASTTQTQKGSFAHCFSPPVEIQDYEINTQGKNQATGAMIGVLLIGVPIMVPDIETYQNKGIDFIVERTTRNACLAAGVSTAYGKKIRGREIQVNAAMQEIHESKCLVRVHVVDDQQSLSPGDKRIFESYQLWSMADGDVRLEKENLTDDEIRAFLVKSGKIKP